MTVADEITLMTERIVRRCDPLAIILFGSQARGDAGPRSDVDLLVVLPDGADMSEAGLSISQEVCGLHPPADVLITTPAEIHRRGNLVGTVLRPALRDGKLLYQRNRNGHLLEAEPVSEEEARKEVQQWLVFAEDDQALAELVLNMQDIMPRQAGYHAQQAAEKALKAIYVFLQLQYPFMHDLDQLRNGLPDGWPIKQEFPLLKPLTDWAVNERYPGAQKEATREDARRHVTLAQALLRAARRDLEQHGFTY
jgi:HEPN domain-containing protein